MFRILIGEFICGKYYLKKIIDDEKEWFENVFEKFKLFWEKICLVVMKVIGIDVLYMIEMKLIFFCLVERRDDGKFLCIVLDVL